jgi:LruC domain-containing protein
MSRRPLLVATLAVGSALLSGYTLTNNAIIWSYFGTPTSTYTYTPSTGAPTMVEFTRTLPVGLPTLPANLLSKVNFTLPEGKDIRQNAQGLVPDSDDKTNLRFSQNADVWVTFVTEGAGYRNSVGYFTYDPAHPPTTPAEVQEKIIFVNTSMSTPLDPASTTKQNTVSLGRFPAGSALGFVIVSDGYSATGRTVGSTKIGGVKESASPKWVFYTLRGLNPEVSSPQNLNVHTVMLKELSNATSTYQLMVIGFEDINRETGGDHDFNDLVLAVHVKPGSPAIANIDTLQPLVSAADQDSDGDGVKDVLDEYPNDGTRAFSRSYPGSTTWGTLAFEDQWPSRGDYDLNDVVMRYRTREILNAQRQVVAVEIDYRADARGGISDSGFGVHLPGISAATVASATISVKGAAPTATGVEAGQTEAVFVVMPSSLAALPSPTGCSFANTQPTNCAAVAAVPYKLTVNFTSPQALSLFTSPYNPFIYRRQGRGQEIHLPGKPPTRLASSSLFGTGVDKSVVGTAYTYMDSQRRPWALDIPTEWVYPKETVDVIKGYPGIGGWAKSGGTTNHDWYLSPVSSFLYAPR